MIYNLSVTSIRIRVSAESEIAAAAYISVSCAANGDSAIIKIVTRSATPRYSRESQDCCENGVRTMQINTGVYFAKHALDFGSVAVGQLAKMKSSLCNTTDDEVGTIASSM